MNLKVYSIFSLFVISILVMLMHNIIPHHHHNHSILSHKEKHCHQEHSETENNESDDAHQSEEPSPFHCHAFNDSEWYKQDHNFRILVKTIECLLVSILEIEEESVSNYLVVEENLTVHKEQKYFRERFSRPPPGLIIISVVC